MAALRVYVAIRGNEDALLFHFRDGRALMRDILLTR